MIDRHLSTFIQVADSGSFLKASEKLYVSANAVAKQINLLEADLGVHLFDRSPKGLLLTGAGKLIYAESKKMIRHADNVLREAKELENQQELVVRIGVSLMNPIDIILDLWNKVAALHPSMKLEVVPFEDSVPSFMEVLDALGNKIDLIACPYQTNYWGDRYSSFFLKDIPTCIACAKTHRLAQKEKLSITDLYGETVNMRKRGLSEHADLMLDELERHPQIHLVEHAYVDYNSFNQLAASQELSISHECWAYVHPLLATLPVDWPYTTPYGLIYTKSPSRAVLDFIMAIGKVE